MPSTSRWAKGKQIAKLPYDKHYNEFFGHDTRCYLPYEVHEGEVALGPPDGALLVVDQVEGLLGDGVQEGSVDMVLVLWGVEDPKWVAVGQDIWQLQKQVK